MGAKNTFDTIGKILKVVIPLAISVGLVFWLFHKVNFDQV